MQKRGASPVLRVRIACCITLVLLLPATALAGATWSGPLSISGWIDATEIYRLLYAADGTAAVIWIDVDAASKQYSFWGRVRPPGGVWSSAANITGWTANLSLNLHALCMEITPDGTPWFLWMEQDKSQPSPNVLVKCAHAQSDGTWKAEYLSSPETEVRTADLAVGPDGHLAAVWSSCSTITGDPSLGSCRVDMRRRPAGTWLAAERVDGAGGVGIFHAMVQAGPSGLTSVTWAEVNPVSSSEWKIAARAHTPGGGWDVAATDVTGWVEPRDAGGWISVPVMGEDGTEILAWVAKTATASAQDAVYSSTRVPGSGSWSSPTKVSADRAASVFDLPWLATRSGTALIAWCAEDNAHTQEAVFANARAPAGVWGVEQQLSTWRYGVTLEELEIWPHNGRCIALWQEEDDGRASTEDEGIFWSVLSPGGFWSLPGQFGAWMESVAGAGIEVTSSGGQGAAEVVWCALDATRPANQQAVAYTASLPLGSAVWTAPKVLTSGLYRMALVPWGWGMRGDASGLPVCAALVVRRLATPPASAFAIQLFEKKQRAPAWFQLLLGP